MISNNSILIPKLTESSNLTQASICDCTSVINTNNAIISSHVNTIYLILIASIIFLCARIAFKYDKIDETLYRDINRYCDIVYFGSAFFLFSHIYMLRSIGVI